MTGIKPFKIIKIQMATIWIFNSPDHSYSIARRSPFGFFSPSVDMRSGHSSLRMMQGVPIVEPHWTWKRKIDKQWFAEFNGQIYEISDLMVQPLRSGPPNVS